MAPEPRCSSQGVGGSGRHARNVALSRISMPDGPCGRFTNGLRVVNGAGREDRSVTEARPRRASAPSLPAGDRRRPRHRADSHAPMPDQSSKPIRHKMIEPSLTAPTNHVTVAATGPRTRTDKIPLRADNDLQSAIRASRLELSPLSSQAVVASTSQLVHWRHTDPPTASRPDEETSDAASTEDLLREASPDHRRVRRPSTARTAWYSTEWSAKGRAAARCRDRDRVWGRGPRLGAGGGVVCGHRSSS